MVARGRFLRFAALLLCLVVALACSRTGAPEGDGSEPGAARELQDFEVTMLDAPPMRLSELVGKDKVVLLNFWATWCGPCRQEMPHLTALQREYRDKGVEFIGLSIENPAMATAEVKAFTREYEVNYRIGFASPEMFRAFNDDPRGTIPQTFIFGRDGRLVKHIRGSHPSMMRAILQEGVEKALQSGQPSAIGFRQRGQAEG